ncbi:integral membrane protein [Hypoxylon sp. EC38]|nr:integral membrane protein [Hypoxylon sp. EC38]
MDEDTNVIVGALMAILSIIIVGMRFYARRYKKAGYKWDDWLIVASLLTMIATDILAICAISANPNGPEAATEANDTHEYTPEDVEYTKLSWTTTVLYFSITATTKLSILLMYHRLFSVSDAFRRQTIVLMALVIAFWFGCTLANLLNCIPMKYTWINSLADPRYCFNYNYYWFASGICEAFLDFWIILMPIRVVISLQLNRKQKIAVTSVFLLGFFVIASGLLKAILGYIPGSREPSFTRTQLWTSVHCGTGIICACLPICWPLFARIGKIHPQTWPGNESVRRLWHNISSASVLGRSRAHKETTIHDLGWASNPTVKGPRKMSTTSGPQGVFIPLRASNEGSQSDNYEYHTSASFRSEMRETISPV